MNPELYERYLAKKAKKLGITVEELKAQGTSSPVKEEEPVQTPPQPAAEPQYVQRTIQEELSNGQTQENIYQPFNGMQPETVITEVPSYIFGPSKMEEPPKYNDLYIADINFDGFSDILFCIGQYGAQGAAYYSCFMWNTEKKCFTLCRDIESVPNLKINAGDKYICGFSRENAVVYVYDIYTWKNGNLKLRYLVYETQDAFTLNRWGDKTAYDVPVLKKAVYKVEEFCNGSRIRQNIVPELSAELENCIHSAGMHAYRTGI